MGETGRGEEVAVTGKLFWSISFREQGYLPCRLHQWILPLKGVKFYLHVKKSKMHSAEYFTWFVTCSSDYRQPEEFVFQCIYLVYLTEPHASCIYHILCIQFSFRS